MEIVYDVQLGTILAKLVKPDVHHVQPANLENTMRMKTYVLIVLVVNIKNLLAKLNVLIAHQVKRVVQRGVRATLSVRIVPLVNIQ